MAQSKLKLTDPEKLLRCCLLDCAAGLSQKPELELRFAGGRVRDKLISQKLELRWTGGWVRDKLLGTQSHDIDVALSTMTGVTFAEQLKLFMGQHGSKYQEEARRIGVSEDLGSLHQIAANPEKSKHLETVTTKMFGLELDFVNLRNETYSDSRNPQMEFGTAQEDALRRDATVNALFYNLHTEEVEDFTERGLIDIDAKIIRTPLQPRQTFEDDPLRVLRLIRFACRLNFQIDGDTQAAMAEDKIHQALQTKISRERVWTEVGKMFSNHETSRVDPCRASILIHDLGLYQCVFGDLNFSSYPVRFNVQFLKGTKPIVYKTLKNLESKGSVLYDYLQIKKEKRDGETKKDSELNWLLAAYSIYGSNEAAVQSLQNALKPAKKYIDILKAATKNLPSIRETIHNAASRFEARSRSQWGMHLYQLGETWPAQYLYAMLHEIGNATEEPEVILDDCKVFMDGLKKQGLLEAASAKPIVNGEELKEALGGARPGKWMTTANQWLLEWQFDHPEASKGDAVNMILGRKEELVEDYGMVYKK